VAIVTQKLSMGSDNACYVAPARPCRAARHERAPVKCRAERPGDRLVSAWRNGPQVPRNTRYRNPGGPGAEAQQGLDGIGRQVVLNYGRTRPSTVPDAPVHRTLTRHSVVTRSARLIQAHQVLVLLRGHVATSVSLRSAHTASVTVSNSQGRRCELYRVKPCSRCLRVVDLRRWHGSLHHGMSRCDE